jgi:hypothetical protein
MVGEMPRGVEENESDYDLNKLIETEFQGNMAALEEIKKVMFPEGDFDLQLRMAKERIKIAQAQNRGNKPDLSPEQQSALNIEAKERQIKLDRLEKLGKLSESGVD